MPHRLRQACRRAVALLIASVSLSMFGVGLPPVHADVTEVTGEAFNYYTDVSLFDGPSMRRGHGQPADAPDAAASPSLECPQGGGTESGTIPDGASAQYGPATIFGGIWPYPESPAAPPSGPLTSRIDCQLGEEGYVTATTLAELMPPGSTWAANEEEYPHPGGIGPGPLIAEEVESTCTMTADGTVTSDVRFDNGIVETSYNPDTQEPATTEPIPENPEPGLVIEGTIDHVGDSYRITFNEQTENPDGSFTVVAAHMELLGPIAVGDMVVGSSTCGLTATPVDTTDPDPAEEDQTPTPSPSPDVATSPAGDEGDGGVPLTAVGIGALVLLGIAAAVLIARRARA